MNTNDDEPNYQDQHLAFLSSIDNLASGEIFSRKREKLDTGYEQDEGDGKE